MAALWKQPDAWSETGPRAAHCALSVTAVSREGEALFDRDQQRTQEGARLVRSRGCASPKPRPIDPDDLAGILLHTCSTTGEDSRGLPRTPGEGRELLK